MVVVEEECFPRGTKVKTSAKEAAQKGIKKKKSDKLFKDVTMKKKKKRPKKKVDKDLDVEHHPKQVKKNADKEKDALTSIEPLSHKLLAEGMNVLSRIQEVREMHLILSLPGRLLATVPITNISAPYSDLLAKLAQDEDVQVKGLKEMFTTGSLMPCSIKEVFRDGSYKVVASVNPADVNSGVPMNALTKGMKITASVRSVEDHVYVLDLGMANVRCMMPKEENPDLAIGEIVHGRITQCQIENAVATVTLSCTSTLKFKQNVELNVATLLPGTNVHVNVKKVTPRGLLVTFGNLLGYVYKDHLTVENLSDYSKNPKLVAVVLYTIPLVNAIYLSLKESLVEDAETDFSHRLELGSVIDNARITESTTMGLFVQLNERAKGFIALRHLSDSHDVVEDVKLHYPVKSTKRCKVLQFASMDEIYICTMKKSLLNQKILRYEDLEVGQLVEAKIESLNAKGVCVQVGAGLKGFVPKLHWADDPRLKKPELRFRPDSTIVCRVLKLDLDKKQLFLTAKKTLTESEEAVFTNAGQLQKNMQLKGTVSLVQTAGVLISFYGDLTGWIPKKRILQRGIIDAGRYFYIGQVIDCCVKFADVESDKVVLDLVMEANLSTEGRKSQDSVQETAPASVSIGSLVRCVVEQVHSQGDNCGIEVLLTNANLKGFIPVDHLSDFGDLCSRLLTTYLPGDVIEEAVIWHRSKLQIVLSLKASLIVSARDGRFPDCFEDIQVNSIYPCVAVRNRDFGVFARLICGPRFHDVLIPKSKILPSLHRAVGLEPPSVSMEGKVLSVDKEAKKVTMSVLPNDLLDHGVPMINYYLSRLDEIRDEMALNGDEASRHLGSLKMGDMILAKVSQGCQESDSCDVELALDSGVRGVVPVYHRPKKSFNVGDSILGCVLYCDVLSGIVYITIKENVIKYLSCLNDAPVKSHGCKGTVILNLKYFSMVMLAEEKKDRAVVLVANINNVNDIIDPGQTRFAVGSRVTIDVDTEENGRLATYTDKRKRQVSERRDRKRKISEQKERKASGKKAKEEPSAEPANNPGEQAEQEQEEPEKDSSGKEQVDDQESEAGGDSGEDSDEDSAAVAKPVEIIKESSKKTPERKDNARKVRTDSKNKVSELPRLQIAKPFSWDDACEPEAASSSSESDSDSDGNDRPALRSKERRERALLKLQKARDEEKKLSALENDLANPNRAPTTADDYDRAILASPNSSILWLQYMAFHLESAEIDKARAVAQRALRIISFREEQEKFNVWIAWLNLEHMYGTGDMFDETFQEALRCNDPLKVYRQMALNFEQNGKWHDADKLYAVMLKKFKQDKAIWLNACVFYVRSGKLDMARSVLQKALVSLDKKEHVDVISRFAQLEVKFGELERGKTMFDTLMLSYPKRTDLWIVYVDTLTKAADIDGARRILERCITLQLAARKMKSIFQKFLDFETTHGDDDRRDYVRQKALQYVESKGAVCE